MVLTFRGTMRRCSDETPHLPHATGEYRTVAWGYLDYFCPGVPGEGAEFTVEYEIDGDAAWPARAKYNVPD